VSAAGSKEGCFLAEFDDAVARIGVVAVAAYAREGGWREKVGACLASVLWLMVDEPGWVCWWSWRRLAAGRVSLSVALSASMSLPASSIRGVPK
jgi:hypothetical protein